MNKRLLEIQSRLDKATKGDWKFMKEGRDHEGGSDFIMVGSGDDRSDDIEILGSTSDDMEFISHSKQDIKFLIEEIKRLTNYE